MFTNVFKNQKLLLALIFSLLVILRIPGLDLPYHQDEYKWAGLVNPELSTPGSVTDPPLTELLFIGTAKVFGYDHFRYMPFFFSLISFFLLFYYVKIAIGLKEALWSVFFFAISYYNVLASLMVDRDGQVIPAIFLLSLIFFHKWQYSDTSVGKTVWFCLLTLALITGFLFRLNFILVYFALFLEFIFLNKDKLKNADFIFKYGSLMVILMMLTALALLNANLIYKPFNISLLINYSSHFAGFLHKNYLQIYIQFFKALLYLSPLFLASMFFVDRQKFSKLRVVFIYLAVGCVFYLGLFDFSSGALDRYFVFTIVPFCVIAGVAAADKISAGYLVIEKKTIYLGLGICTGLFLLQFLLHYVPALYPKPEWFYRVLSFKWNFLMPFFGGSGPLGFYVSWLLIGFSWILVGVFTVSALFKKKLANRFFILILMIGLFYNLIFIEEYLLGRINGNSADVLRGVQAFVLGNPNIKKVITYNDIGAYELRKAGKYQRRLYVAPKFEGSYQDVLNNFKSYYMVLEIPKIDPDSIYAKYFSTCEIIYEEFSGVIPAMVYDCKNAQDI